MTAPAAAAPVSLDLEHMTAEERVRWAVETFGDGLVMSSSFGIESAVMLHLVTRIAPQIPVIFIDTCILATWYFLPIVYCSLGESQPYCARNCRSWGSSVESGGSHRPSLSRSHQ